MLRTAAALLFLLLSAESAWSQAAIGSATLDMRQSLTVGAARPMSPSGADAVSQVRLEEGSYQIIGDPDRAYRVRTVVAAGEAPPVIQSSNAGEISEGGLGRLDAQGRDTIRITPALPRDGSAPAPVSLTIDYE